MPKVTPRKAIRAYCSWCSKGQLYEIKQCHATECSFHLFRSGKREPEQIPALKGIRNRCIQCAETLPEIKDCNDQNCPLHPYRMGHNPKRTGIGSVKAFAAKINPTQTPCPAHEIVQTTQDTTEQDEIAKWIAELG